MMRSAMEKPLSQQGPFVAYNRLIGVWGMVQAKDAVLKKITHTIYLQQTITSPTRTWLETSCRLTMSYSVFCLLSGGQFVTTKMD